MNNCEKCGKEKQVIHEQGYEYCECESTIVIL